MQNLAHIKFLQNSKMAEIIRHFLVTLCGPRVTRSVSAVNKAQCNLTPDYTAKRKFHF